MSEWKIRFGTAGTSDSFTAMGYKNSLDIPAYTEKMGLDAFEYQCGRGIRLGLDKARQMADDAAAREDDDRRTRRRRWRLSAPAPRGCP